ncbi:UNVERIFIED_CONTAM: hypothetical protein B566_EDAN015871 [Ephemera danica]|nr:hypothetical protein B566_EDAN015871 [Ephemera danica]
MSSLQELSQGLLVDPLPPPRQRDEKLPHAPVRTHGLSRDDQKLAIKNALRYFPANTHEELAPEFLTELRQYGHIYMYRFMPSMHIRAYPINAYPARTKEGAAILHMLMNNLDPAVAQYPQELVTYGGNGQVLSNWAQFRLLVRYLCELDETQTLVMCSGHPLGLFPSLGPLSPRLVITNGMMVPNYSTRTLYDRLFALGVTMYGQMTAGSYCYIGPQGIVHGTTITVLNAGRRYLGSGDLSGKVFVTSGLGGMSGAQAKAAVIAGCVGIVAEVSEEALHKRHAQGWLTEVESDLERLIARIRLAKCNKEAVSIGFHGNVVLLWERLADELKHTGDCLVELGSDQTSLHDPHRGGYWPVQIPYEQARKLLAEDTTQFRELVSESLRRQVAAINFLTDHGCLHFWDYGNAFLLESSRAGAPVLENDVTSDLSACEPDTNLVFRYPSYVQDIMGNIFSLGFGPFRWVCTSGEQSDLELTDQLAAAVIENIMAGDLPDSVRAQYADNLRWIREAGQHRLVVGSQARILYADARGRVLSALAFNAAIRDGRIKGPVVISRDHHDVSGTDSPYRETSNIADGSAFTADMAVQNCIGDAFRGATWVALHNGGGVGWGEVMNGGFGLVLDGSVEGDTRVKLLLAWDVNNGVARRCWSGNANARLAISAAMESEPRLRVTLPYEVNDPELLNCVVDSSIA